MELAAEEREETKHYDSDCKFLFNLISIFLVRLLRSWG